MYRNRWHQACQAFSGSKGIVAINNNKEANIFSADFGIAGDYKEVLPALTAKLRELKSK